MAWLDSKKPSYSQSTPIKAEEKINEAFQIGDKISVNESTKGTIRFIGKTDFKAGTWIGIELDKVGTGKNDGSINSKRYFVCPPNTGLFISANKLLKQQLNNRPSTPYQKLNKKVSMPSISTMPTNIIPPLPSISTTTINTTTPPLPVIPTTTLPPLPSTTKSSPLTTFNDNKLQQKLKQVELENKKLKESNKKLKKTSIESIEILENLLELEYEKYEKLKKTNQELLVENKNLKFKENQYLKDISILELVLKSKQLKELDLIQLVIKERKLSSKLLNTRLLDTPIEDDDVDNFCPLCSQHGHNLIHCKTITTTTTTTTIIDM